MNLSAIQIFYSVGFTLTAVLALVFLNSYFGSKDLARRATSLSTSTYSLAAAMFWIVQSIDDLKLQTRILNVGFGLVCSLLLARLAFANETLENYKHGYRMVITSTVLTLTTFYTSVAPETGRLINLVISLLALGFLVFLLATFRLSKIASGDLLKLQLLRNLLTFALVIGVAIALCSAFYITNQFNSTIVMLVLLLLTASSFDAQKIENRT